MPTDPIIDKAAQLIASAETLLITAGAGMGVDSGLPDFRGHQGFWKTYPKYAEAGLSFTDLANPVWFETHPEQAWEFYGYRYNLYRDTTPHQGFQLLKKWQASAPHPGFVLTSNVDGHFQKAGFATAAIYECHGSIHHLQCSVDCSGKIWSADKLRIEVDPIDLLAKSALPRCPECGQLARPNIKMFGDYDWTDRRANEQKQRYMEWKRLAVNYNTVVIEIGAGYSVGVVRSASQAVCLSTLIRINTCDAEGPEGTLSIAMPALTALRAIDKVMRKHRQSLI